MSDPLRAVEAVERALRRWRIYSTSCTNPACNDAACWDIKEDRAARDAALVAALPILRALAERTERPILGAPVNLERLARNLLQFTWQRECQIIPEYMPPFPRGDQPRCVVQHRERFLRYSRGPAQGYSWDCYGDDFLCPELALIAISQAPMPGAYLTERPLP